MPRYVAFLRGVSPLNCKMPALKRCFEQAGFTDVRTLLSSGNVAFSTPRAAAGDVLERKVVRAMRAHLDRVFVPFVRPATHLQGLLAADGHASFTLPPAAKRIITFLHGPPPAELVLPLSRDGATMLKAVGHEVLSAYAPTADGPAFMRLLERSLGSDITTRTLDTVRRCACA